MMVKYQETVLSIPVITLDKSLIKMVDVRTVPGILILILKEKHVYQFHVMLNSSI